LFLLILALWIIFNGQLTVEIFVLGLIFASVMYLFLVKVLHFSYKKDIAWAKKSGYIIEYLIVLFVEIVKANIAVGKIMMSSEYDVEPAVVKFRSNLKSEKARVILANSITLTPGTISISCTDEHFIVHCLKKEYFDGFENSLMVKLLLKMEAK